MNCKQAFLIQGRLLLGEDCRLGGARGLRTTPSSRFRVGGGWGGKRVGFSTRRVAPWMEIQGHGYFRPLGQKGRPWRGCPNFPFSSFALCNGTLGHGASIVSIPSTWSWSSGRVKTQQGWPPCCPSARSSAVPSAPAPTLPGLCPQSPWLSVVSESHLLPTRA